MAKDDKNLDFDLDFLDKESPADSKKATKKRKRKSGESFVSPGVKDRLKLWGIGIAVVFGLVFFGAIFSDDTSTSSNYTAPTSNSNSSYSNNDDMVTIGEYSCSRYHYNRAVELDPSESEWSLNLEQSQLASRGREIDRLANEIESSYVTEYSPQWQINEYNAKIDEYNSKLTSYNRDVANIDVRIDAYNAKIERHNNYLVENCTPNR